MSDESGSPPNSGNGLKALLRIVLVDPWLPPRREDAGAKMAGGLVLLALFAWLVGPEILLRVQGETTDGLIARAWEDYEVREMHERERLALVCLASYQFDARDGTTVTGTRECPSEVYRLAGTRHRRYWVVPDLEVDANGEYVLDPHRPVIAKVRYLPTKPSRNHFLSEERYTMSQTVLGGAFVLVWLNAAIGCVASAVLALNR